jgi:hypothetical protein
MRSGEIPVFALVRAFALAFLSVIPSGNLLHPQPHTLSSRPKRSAVERPLYSLVLLLLPLPLPFFGNF